MDLKQALLGQVDSQQEAENLYNEIKDQFNEMLMNGEDPSEVLYDYGLEPDYLEDFLF